jgi:hypothetical protein
MPRMSSMRPIPMSSGFGMPEAMQGVMVVAINEPPFGGRDLLPQMIHPAQHFSAASGARQIIDQRAVPVGFLMQVSAQHQALHIFRANEAMIARQRHGDAFQHEAQPINARCDDHPTGVSQQYVGLHSDMNRAETLARQFDEHSPLTPENASTSQPENHSTNAASSALSATARRLMPEPGVWKVVRYADFVDLLSPQLQNPGRLQPGHQLACYVQVYELTAPCGLTSLEDKTSTELGKIGKLKLLSYDLCRQFSFNLPRQPLALTDNRGAHSTGLLPAGARFITLRLAIDPTAEKSQKFDAATPGQRETTSQLKFAIPTEAPQPWEICLSREEAIYDMMAANNSSWLRKFLKRLLGRASSGEIKKWQALLVGKPLEQQLWRVRPPKDAFHGTYVKCWLTQTLQLDGYDVARMTAEWEIFWRQRGL